MSVQNACFDTGRDAADDEVELRLTCAMVHGFRVDDRQQHSGVFFARRLAHKGFTQECQASLTKYLVTQETHVFVVGLR